MKWLLFLRIYSVNATFDYFLNPVTNIFSHKACVSGLSYDRPADGLELKFCMRQMFTLRVLISMFKVSNIHELVTRIQALIILVIDSFVNKRGM